MDKYNREQHVLIEKNIQASLAVIENDITMMERILETGGLEKEAIDNFIFCVKSVDMLKLFLRFGGDVHKLGRTPKPLPSVPQYYFGSD